jgi:hypothetical protein
MSSSCVVPSRFRCRLLSAAQSSVPAVNRSPACNSFRQQNVSRRAACRYASTRQMMANQASVPQNQWSPAMRQVLADIRQSLASPSARRPASSRLVPHVLATLTSTDGPHSARLSPAEKAGLLVGSWRLLRRLRELHSAVFPVQTSPMVAGTITSSAAAVAALSSDAAAVTAAYAKKQLCLGDSFLCCRDASSPLP